MVSCKNGFLCTLQNEAKCKNFSGENKIYLHENKKNIFISLAWHLASLWNRGLRSCNYFSEMLLCRLNSTVIFAGRWSVLGTLDMLWGVLQTCTSWHVLLPSKLGHYSTAITSGLKLKRWHQIPRQNGSGQSRQRETIKETNQNLTQTNVAGVKSGAGKWFVLLRLLIGWVHQINQSRLDISAGTRVHATDHWFHSSFWLVYVNSNVSQ